MSDQRAGEGVEVWTFDVAMILNFEGPPSTCVRMLVQVPYIDGEEMHERAAEVAKDALRPFLKSDVCFGDQVPMIVEVARA